MTEAGVREVYQIIDGHATPVRLQQMHSAENYDASNELYIQYLKFKKQNYQI